MSTERSRNKARDAALERLLDELEDKLCAEVAETMDFARIDSIERAMVLELERLIAAGQLPPAPDARAIEARAATMIERAIYAAADDPRRNKHAVDDDDCELCRELGMSRLVS